MAGPIRIARSLGHVLTANLGAPRHYHLPADTPANLDAGEIQLAVDFLEQLLRSLVRRRTAP